jgi:hypothetical protein
MTKLKIELEIEEKITTEFFRWWGKANLELAPIEAGPQFADRWETCEHAAYRAGYLKAMTQRSAPMTTPANDGKLREFPPPPKPAAKPQEGG